MKKFNVIIFSILAALMLAACGNKVDEATAEKYTEKAEEIVQLLNNGDYEAITKDFDETMKANLTVEQLAAIEPVLITSGSFEKVEKKSVEQKDGYYVAVLVVKHSEDNRIYTVTYDENDKIAGLLVQ